MKKLHQLGAVCALLFASTQAFATSISLGGAGDFAVFALDSSSMFMGNDPTTITGNVGIGPNSDADLTKGTINGDLSYDSSTGTINVGVTVSGTTNSNTNLSAATSDAVTAAGLFSGLTATDLTTSLTGGESFTGNGGDNIFDLTGGVNLNNVADVTLQGGVDDYYIFNVSGTFDFASTNIILDGVSADHVIWNVSGSGNVLLGNSGIFNGTVLAVDRDIYVDHLTVNGALIGGQTFYDLANIDKDHAGISIHSDAIINYVGFSAVPVPAAAWLFGSGLLGLVGIARRNKKAA